LTNRFDIFYRFGRLILDYELKKAQFSQFDANDRQILNAIQKGWFFYFQNKGLFKDWGDKQL
jgi:hypothetical protein